MSILTSMLLAASTGLLTPATVGDFLVGVAQTKGIVRDDPAAAREELDRQGYGLPGIDLAKTLTEADVVRIGNALGLGLATTQPASTFDLDRMQRFLKAVGPRMASTEKKRAGEDSGSGTRKKPKSKSPKGKGKGKGHSNH